MLGSSAAPTGGSADRWRSSAAGISGRSNRVCATRMPLFMLPCTYVALRHICKVEWLSSMSCCCSVRCMLFSCTVLRNLASRKDEKCSHKGATVVLMTFLFKYSWSNACRCDLQATIACREAARLRPQKHAAVLKLWRKLRPYLYCTLLSPTAATGHQMSMGISVLYQTEPTFLCALLCMTQ